MAKKLKLLWLEIVIVDSPDLVGVTLVFAGLVLYTYTNLRSQI